MPFPESHLHESHIPEFDDREPRTLATPEGDAEYLPDQPLQPDVVEAEVAGLETPSGSAPAPEHHKPSLLETVIDEISHGTLLP